MVDRCQELVDGGMPVGALEEVDFGPLVRAREETGTDDAEGVRRRGADVLAALEELA